MSYLWGKLDRLVAGPALMFVLQNLVFWTAAAIFWRTTRGKSFGLATALILLGLLPQILSQLTTVWKDVGLGACLFLTAALVYQADQAKSKCLLLISPVFLFYGYAVRLNAFPAVLPLAIWSGIVAARIFEFEKRKFAAVLIGFGYFFALSAAGYLVSHKITDERTVYPAQQIFLYDLAAISAARGEALFPEYVLKYENFSLEIVKSRYNIISVNDLIYADAPHRGDLPVLPLTVNAEEISALRSKWFESVAAHPLNYLSHRGKVFAQLVGLGYSVTRPYWDIGFASSPPEFRGQENFAGKVLTEYFSLFRRPVMQTFAFRGFVWLSLSAFFLYQALKNKLRADWEIVFVLSASGLLFALAYFPTTPSTEFRYLFWSAISSATAIVWGTYLLSQQPDGNFLNKFLLKLRK
ncbi:MAG: hypothetical protein LH472_10720, partial [Pyrinomonadaceae bacterium]|nr:hypothetical protein [Pyrinomonadaceae bacterium]